MSSSGPASRFFPAVPSDTTEFATGECRALFVGVGGDVVAIDGPSGAAVTFKNVPSGSILPIQTSRLTTATTATSIVALH